MGEQQGTAKTPCSTCSLSLTPSFLTPLPVGSWTSLVTETGDYMKGNGCGQEIINTTFSQFEWSKHLYFH